VIVNPGSTNGTYSETMGFISVENKNLILSTIKKCDDDNNVILRCYDIEGKDTEAKISIFKPFQNAELTNLIEEDGKPITGNGTGIGLKVGHNSIETIKLHMK
jgi:alpha-mannosidase